MNNLFITAFDLAFFAGIFGCTALFIKICNFFGFDVLRYIESKLKNGDEISEEEK